METRSKVSGEKWAPKESNTGGQTAVQNQKISNFSTCKVQGN